jgi:hypothetical protein
VVAASPTAAISGGGETLIFNGNLTKDKAPVF